MTESTWDSDDQRWADVAVVAKAVRQHLETAAYLLTGGSDGCASCADLTTAERVARGGPHVECAENGVAFNAAKRLVASACDFDLQIAVSRSFDDPRMFQWVREASR